MDIMDGRSTGAVYLLGERRPTLIEVKWISRLPTKEKGIGTQAYAVLTQ